MEAIRKETYPAPANYIHMSSPTPIWPPPPDPGTNIPSSAARIVVTAGYNPLTYMYGLVTPTITINGYRERRPWGTYAFDVPPGDYEIAVSYPWLFVPECGRNQVRFRIQPGEIRTVTYQAGLLRFIPGSISVW